MDRIVAYVKFLGGASRPVYEQPGGRQYVHDDDGEQVFGVWYWEPEADKPATVERQDFRRPQERQHTAIHHAEGRLTSRPPAEPTDCL